MKKYKLWVYVEEIIEEEDHYEDIGEPSSLGEFDTLKEAEEYVSHLQEIQP